MDRKTYIEQLPKKRMGAGGLFRNDKNQILLVKPNYKPLWEIPGGMTENLESPRACATREILEELNLEIVVGRLLIVDYNSSTDDYLESLMWVFDGGILNDSQIQNIKLQASELEEYRFVEVDTLPHYLIPRLTRRLTQAFQAVLNHQTLYTENQIAI